MKFASLAAAAAALLAAPAFAQTTGPAAPAPAPIPTEKPTVPQLAPPVPPQPSPEEAKTAEAALRKVIHEFATGTLDYANMTDELSGMIKPHADQVKNILTGLGEIKTVSILGYSPDDGVVFFRVAFANGATDWAIKVGADGKLQALAVRPAVTSG
jgi:hypothetical protein